MNWSEYTEIARGLGAVLRNESQRRHGAAARVEQDRGVLVEAERRLDVQRHHLTEAASRLRVSAPRLRDVAPAGEGTLAVALSRAGEALTEADRQLAQAMTRAQRPQLLPELGDLSRAVLVYCAATLATLVASCGLLRFNYDLHTDPLPLGMLPWQLCGLPAVTFFAGFAVLSFFGRPRIGEAPSPMRSARLGFAICFLGMWLGFIPLLVLAK